MVLREGENTFLQVILTLPAPEARESEPLPVHPAFLFLTLRRPHKDLQGALQFLEESSDISLFPKFLV